MLYLEDFTPGQVIELGSKTVSEEEILTFAREFDPQPFHVDPERARDEACDRSHQVTRVRSRTAWPPGGWRGSPGRAPAPRR